MTTTSDNISRIKLILLECPDLLDALGKIAIEYGINTLFSKKTLDYEFFTQLSEAEKISFIQSTFYYTPFGSDEARPNQTVIKKIMEFIQF
jgi:hypothetical protein